MRLFVNSIGGLAANTEQLILLSVTYPNDLGYQSLNLMPYGLSNYQYAPQIWTILDKTFIVVTGDGTGNGRYYLYILDHFTHKISNAIYTNLEAVGEDVHHISAIIGTMLNELFITQTSRHGSSGNWTISKSGIDYDILNFNAWTDTGVNEFTYHQLQVFANGDIYDMGRLASISENYAYGDIYKSVNNGVSFSKIGRIIDWGVQVTDDRYIPYPMLIYSNDDVLRLVINNLYYTANPNNFRGGKTSYYLESIDGGVMWRNIDNTFSKDITVAPLTLSEMNTNMVMYSLTNNTDIIRANGSQLINGVPYVLGGSGDVANSPLALYYWSGSAWIQKIITSSGHTIVGAYTSGVIPFNNSTSIYKNGNDLDLYCIESVAGIGQMSLFRSSDNGDTWVFVEQLTNTSFHSMNVHVNKNITDSTNKAIACIDDHTTYANLFIGELY